jgi:hypothetical protein
MQQLDNSAVKPGGHSAAGIVAASIGVCIAFAIANSSVTLLMDIFSPQQFGALLVFAIFGAILAQAGLLAIWGVFGCQSVLRRLLFGVAVAGILFFAFALGAANSTQFSHSRFWQEEVGKVLAVAPLILLSIQSPLWLAKIWFGWRIERADSVDNSPRRQFRIADMLILTALVAGSLGLAKWALGSQFGNGLMPWIPLAIAVGSSAAASLIFILAAITFALRMRINAINITAVLFWTVATTGGVWGSFALIQQAPDAWATICMGLVIGSFTACLIGPLLLVRWGGYRLAWGSDSGAGFAEIQMTGSSSARTCP